MYGCPVPGPATASDSDLRGRAGHICRHLQFHRQLEVIPQLASQGPQLRGQYQPKPRLLATHFDAKKLRFDRVKMRSGGANHSELPMSALLSLPQLKQVPARKPNSRDLLPLEKYDHILVSFSGGRDSLALVL